MSFTVAIDGPAAAGKGTIAKAVAAHFRFAHLDTGLLYRAVGAKTLDGADPVEAARNLDPVDLENARLRTPDVAQAASRVAVLPDVRAALADGVGEERVRDLVRLRLQALEKQNELEGEDVTSEAQPQRQAREEVEGGAGGEHGRHAG